MTKACGTGTYNPATQDCVVTKATSISTPLYQALTKSNYQSKCGGDVSIICDWGQDCYTDDPTDPTCCEKGEEICLDVEGTNPVCCGFGSTCCDGSCCASSRTCVAATSRANVFWNKPGTGRTAATVSAANEWKLPDGTVAEIRPRVCSAVDKLSGPASIKVVIYPLFAMLGLIISFGMVAKTTGISPISIGGPAAISVFCSIFFCFTNKLLFLAFFVVLSCCFALGAAHKGGSPFVYSMMFTFLVMAVMSDGFGLGTLFVNEGRAYQYDTTGSVGAGWGELTTCTTYFDYFGVGAANPIYSSPLDRSWGYCSEGWFTYQMFAYALCFVSQMIMLVGTGLAYLEGSPKV